MKLETVVADVTLGLVEVPSEISLCIPIIGCEGTCKGCHSPSYWKGCAGDELTFDVADALIDYYANRVTCVCFLGGEWNPDALVAVIQKMKENFKGRFALYSGKESIQEIPFNLRQELNYIKLGPYVEELGGLHKRSTNQRLYKLPVMEDITYKFWTTFD